MVRSPFCFPDEPSITNVKNYLDHVLGAVHDIDGCDIPGYTPSGNDLVKKYWLVNNLEKSLKDDKQVTLSESEKAILLKNTSREGLGFFKLDPTESKIHFAFWDRIIELFDRILGHKTHSAALLDKVSKP